MSTQTNPAAETLTAGEATLRAIAEDKARKNGAKARLAAFFADNPKLAPKAAVPSAPMAAGPVGQWDGVGEEVDEG